MNPTRLLRQNPTRIQFLQWLPLALGTSLATLGLTAFTQAAELQPSLIATITINGSASDLSDQQGAFDNGVPKNQLGGFSAIAAAPQPGQFYVLSDRGPCDGEYDYPTRFHLIEITGTPDAGQNDAAQNAQVRMLKTHVFRRGEHHFSGSSNVNTPGSVTRLDPEGIRTMADGRLLVSDEYGPHLHMFTAQGELVRQYEIPEMFSVTQTALTKQEENQLNQRGRQGNAGFEGLALSQDQRYAYAILQGPMLQDHAFDKQGTGLGRLVRILRVDLSNGQTQQFAYQLESPEYGVSEILAYDDDSFLVLERDGLPGSQSRCKSLYRIQFSGATDISGVASLPVDLSDSPGITPVSKTLYLDMLDPRYGLSGSIAKKIEGICWGTFPNRKGRVLVICSDNDFEPSQASEFYLFDCN